jgi:hypothetical protein
MVTHGGKLAKKVYRYYRCRTTAGGRAPCKGQQIPAGEIERFVCGMSGRPESWNTILRSRPEPLARSDVLVAAWNALAETEQRSLLPRLVRRVLVDGKLGRCSVEWDPALTAIIECAARQRGGARRRSLSRSM